MSEELLVIQQIFFIGPLSASYVLDYLLRRSRKLVFILTNLTLLDLKVYSVSY